ncbi:MAG: MutS family DNA mismatch repair protein [Gemmatimonadota bacterium]
MTHEPAAAYEERRERYSLRAEAGRRRSVKLSTWRAVTFIAAMTALLAWDVLEGGAARAGLGIGVALLVVFAVQVVRHRRLRRQIRWNTIQAGLAEEGLLRLRRDWDALDHALPAAEAAEEPVPPEHPYGRDLDVTGRASLLRLMGPVTSQQGRKILRGWLLGEEEAEVIPGQAAGRAGDVVSSSSARQEAVRELAPLLDLRMEFAAHGRVARERTDARALTRFLEWAEADPWLLELRWIRVLSVVSPPLLIVGAMASILWSAPPLWILPFLLQLEMMRRTSRRLGAEFSRAEEGYGTLEAYVPQLAMVCGEEWEAPALREIVADLRGGGVPARARLQELLRLLDSVESRRNMFYAALSPLLMLDVHLGARLDRWRRDYGARVRVWLHAAGRWEALAAMASLAHDHPDWAFPEWNSDPLPMRASALGHPLIPPPECVRNDVAVGPAGTFLFVTGSNMSGKSTLLRALGTNAVLAAAGAPVCASSLTLPPVRVHTVMRVEDSLARGISLFMAELLRVREVVKAAETPDRWGKPVLFLLDEILHGTNTAERRVAARAVLRHLLRHQAIGAVSTHDLALCETPELEQAARPAHFREEVVRENGVTRVTFDYVLRPGVATTRNALKLLEAVGLGDLVEE